MRIIIVAISTDGFIGRNGELPWRLKSDVDHFKNTTCGHVVVMGRKTWESIPSYFRPLSDRRNIIISRQTGYFVEGAEVAHSIEEALALTEVDEFEHGRNVFIMGGREIYQAAMSHAERLLITHVHKIVGKEGDVRFPPFPSFLWNLVSETERVQGEGDECSFTIEDFSPNLPFIELANVRTPSQLQVMRKIRKAGHCPFCPENLHLYHKLPITWEGRFWIVTDNQWPYQGRNVHKLVILKEHVVSIEGMPRGAMEELAEIARLVKEETGVAGGAIAMREGDPILSGASVRHIHAQIISPQRGSRDRVRIFVGTGTREVAP